MTTKQHLLSFSIGPVQSFIAEARRTADLYAGSRMLVELARAMAKTIQSGNGELIYPASDHLDKADMPNKMVAVVDDVEAITRNVQIAMLKKWAEFAGKSLTNLQLGVLLEPHESDIKVTAEDPVLQAILERHLNNHLEFYWASAEYVDDGGASAGMDTDKDAAYMRAYEAVERALGARKQTRNFAQVAEEGFKDALSGTRSALRRKTDKDARAFWLDRYQSRKDRKLREGELLDTLGTLKRFIEFENKKRFPSTSRVAATSFINSCAEAGILGDFRKAIEKFNDNHDNYFYTVVETSADSAFAYDGDLLFPETYAPARLRENYGLPRNVNKKNQGQVDAWCYQVKQKICDGALQALYKQAAEKSLQLRRPSPYYAVLQMDGDKMGAHIRECEKKDEHQKVSRLLDEFTQEVQSLVEAEQGYLVYAGGDDVLALFPAHCVLSAADNLAEAYRQVFENWAHGHQTDDKKPFPFTASVGIALAHHLDPLDLVLRTARQAEKRAKNHYGRDAVAVTFLRRSGATLEVGGKWNSEGDDSKWNTIKMVNQLSEWLANEEIASRFPYSVLREAEVVTQLNTDGRKAMLKLLLGRHVDPEKATFNMDDVLGSWMAWAEKHDKLPPASSDGETEGDTQAEGSHQQGYLELARWFVVAGWLSTGGQE